MAASMRDAGEGTATQPAAASNFDADDNGEWDVGIGDLIIDLDADIEKEAGGGGGGGGGVMASQQRGTTATQSAAAAATGPSLKMKIKRTKPGTKSSEVKHEIVKSNETNGEVKTNAAQQPQPVAAPIPPVKRGSGGHRRDKARDKTPDVNGVARPTPPTPPRPSTAPSVTPTTPNAPGPPPAVMQAVTPNAVRKDEDEGKRPSSPQQPAAKKQKIGPIEPQANKETSEVCVGTSVGTITEPDCLGPCEPGTSVTLEGIVWHETEGGVLVVNVTWRGKTYVGTLLDCTRHDWAPPRFCDSPSEELDARTPKARAKRGRQQPDLANFTETRSSVHSKLRNGAKGRRAQPSPTPPKTEHTVKRKLEPPPEIKPPKRQPPGSPPPEPILIECPEPNCSKKYKHANGLKYHRSHAHGISDDDDIKDGSASDDDDAPTEPASPTPQPPPTPSEADFTTPRKDETGPPTTRPSPTPIDVKTPTALKPTALRFAQEENQSSEEKETVQPLPPAPVTQLGTGFTPVAKVIAPTAMGQPLAPSPLRPTATPPSPSSAPPPLGVSLGLAMERPKGIGPPPSPQFKVKTIASLMPTEERKPVESPTDESRRRTSTPPPPERSFGREGVQSPAYSDISDDTPSTEVDGAQQVAGEAEPPFNPYPFYGRPPFMPPPPESDPKDDLGDRNDPKHDEIERNEPPPQQRKLPPQHFYPYGYVPPGFAYGVDSDFGSHQQANPNDDDEGKQGPKPPAPRSMKTMESTKEGKHQNENHQILKESIEMKNQMGPYGPYQPMPQMHPREAEKFDKRRYYLLEQQRRKEGEMMKMNVQQKQSGPPRASPARDPIKGRDEMTKIKEEPKPIKQEGQKPTTETTGPPPPPTSQYYLHPPPPFVQPPPHYGTLPFDSMYRGAPVLVGSPFGGPWGVPRYHAPEDLSRPPHYSAPPHKIHELQERASGSPPSRAPPAPPPPAPRPVSAPSPPPPNKDGTGARSPPPQRHVHTHHHTHVGLGYPLYAPSYGAAVLASQQAVVSAFPPSGAPPQQSAPAPNAPPNK